MASRQSRSTELNSLLFTYPANEDENFDYTFKIIFIGDLGVGKTSALQRFRFGTYSEKHASTLGVDFSFKTLKMSDNKVVQLHMWDTAGQERYRTITQSYYRNTHGVVIAYDITKERSFYNLQRIWLEDIRKYCGNTILIYIIGTKLDLVTANENLRAVSKESVQNLVDTQRNIIGYKEISAKHGINVNETFKELTVAMRQKVDRSMTSELNCELSQAFPGNLDTRQMDEEQKRKRRCC